MTEEQMKMLNDICFSLMLNYNKLSMLLQTLAEEQKAEKAIPKKMMNMEKRNERNSSAYR